MISIGTVVDRNRGIGPGYDFLRVALAVAVVAWHAQPIATGSNELNHAWAWFPSYAILGAFFGLSGYLITGSASRLNLSNFLINRGLRIFPALIVETFLSAVVLGLLFSVLSVGDYFTDPLFFGYFTSIVGYIKYYLPGMFESNPIPQINLSLWTVPYELFCYAIMSAFIITGALKRSPLIIGVAVLFMLLGVGLTAAGVEHNSGPFVTRVLHALFVDKASRLMVCFLLGIAAYLFRYRIPYNWRLFAMACIICLLMNVFWPTDNYVMQNIIIGPPIVYMTVFLGATPLPKLPFLDRGDYSYGIYLYGAPIQQAVRATFPWTNTQLTNFLMSMPFIIIFAVFSWHCIEKPILHLRRRFSFVARMRLENEAIPVMPPADAQPEAGSIPPA